MGIRIDFLRPQKPREFSVGKLIVSMRVNCGGANLVG